MTRVCLIDNYDSFTYNLQHLLLMQGVAVDVFLHDVPRESVRLNSYTHLVISPGPGSTKDTGHCRYWIEVAMDRGMPIMGVCLGHQLLAEMMGASLRKLECPIHGKTTPIYHDGGGLYMDAPSGFDAMHYHSWVVERPLPDELKETAWCLNEKDECLNMSFEHRELPIYGMQYHPESILTKPGDMLMQRFLTGAQVVATIDDRLVVS